MDNVLTPNKLAHSWLEDALALLFGTLMISFGIILFRQAGALTGGTAGIAFLIHYAAHVPFGVAFFAINLPFYWLSVRRMGAVHPENLLCGSAGVVVFRSARPLYPFRPAQSLLRHAVWQHCGGDWFCGAVPP
jgi:uncharacterized membrane-anchored protein YitT (DUF2179 family)